MFKFNSSENKGILSEKGILLIFVTISQNHFYSC